MFTDYLSWVYYVSATVLRKNWRFNGELKQVKISMSLKKKSRALDFWGKMADLITQGLTYHPGTPNLGLLPL